MRFTRPGARPCHAAGRSRLGSTKLRGFVLGARVDDERPGTELGSSQVLQLVARAVWGIELDVEVMLLARPARGRWVHGHHIWQRTVEQAVVLLEHAFQDSRERLGVVWIEVEQTRAMAHRREMHFVGPPREWRHEGDPVLIPEDCSFAAG